jgi:hypothetical protein
MKSKVQIMGIYVFSIVLFLLGYFFEDLNSAILIFVICIIPLFFVNYINTYLLFTAKDFKNKKITYFILLSILPVLSFLVFLMDKKDFKILSLTSLISLIIINFTFLFKSDYFIGDDN